MKKMIALLLVIAFVPAMLGGCAVINAFTDDVDPTVYETEAPYIEDTTDYVPEPTIEDTTGYEELLVTRGEFEGKTYMNTIVNLSCGLGEDWQFFSDEEIAENDGISAEDLSEENFPYTAENNQVVTDMTAFDSQARMIYICYENLDFTSATDITQEEYIQDYFIAGEEVVADFPSYEFASDIYAAALIKSEGNYMACYAKKYGKYMFVVILAAESVDAIDEIETMFY